MARVTDSEVRDILNDIDASKVKSTTPFINAASMMVDDVCVVLEYTDAKLKIIEQWLAAHLIACVDQRPASEAVSGPAGGVSQTYQYAVGRGLDLTAYGQQVKRLDTKGGLAALDNAANQRTASSVFFKWLGTEKE